MIESTEQLLGLPRDPDNRASSFTISLRPCLHKIVRKEAWGLDMGLSAFVGMLIAHFALNRDEILTVMTPFPPRRLSAGERPPAEFPLQLSLHFPTRKEAGRLKMRRKRKR